MERQFSDYRLSVCKKLSERVEPLTKKASGKYRFLATSSCGKAIVEPVPFPGYTVVAEPYAPIDLQRALEPIFKEIFIAKISGFAPVPKDSLHMTIADLVSGNQWNVPPDNLEEQLIKNAYQVLSDFCSENLKITGTIRGVGCFPSVIIALVDFADEKDYTKITEIRNAIYGDPELAMFGVERKFPFQGHVTLGYLESAPVEGLNKFVDQINGNWKDIEFNIEGVSVYSFKDMSQYAQLKR